jgi:methylthioribose-1-phosphate isomerase
MKGYGTALGLITHHETGHLGRAYYTQTAPYHQGSRYVQHPDLCSSNLINLARLTALELQTLKIPSTMICDTMVGSLFQHHTIHAVGGFELAFYPASKLNCHCSLRQRLAQTE